MIKLLVVDDSNVIRSRIDRIYAKKTAIKVVGKAVNGKQAICLANEFEPDIVTMDLTMPKMDGIECIEKLIDMHPTIKILVVSALSDQETGLDAVLKGARGFLCKPFSDQDLIEALDKLIASKDKVINKKR